MKETDYETAKSNFDKASEIRIKIEHKEKLIERNKAMIKQVEDIAGTYLNFQPINNSDLARHWLTIGLNREIHRFQNQIIELINDFSELMGNPTESV